MTDRSKQLPTLDEWNAYIFDVIPWPAEVLCPKCKTEMHYKVETGSTLRNKSVGRAPDGLPVYCPKCEYKGYKR